MSEIPETRASLLISLCQHSEDAWAEFLTIYEQAVMRFCVSKGLQEADCRDVFQDVLAAVIKKIPSWDHRQEKGRFRGWLFTVARNIAVDLIDRKAKKELASGKSTIARMLNEIPDPVAAKEISFEMEYRRALFDWASRQVKSEIKDITWKSFYQTAILGQPAEEVAGQLGIPVGSVYTAKCRVVARIRNKVAEVGDELEPEFK